MKIDNYPVLLINKRFRRPVQESLDTAKEIDESLSNDLANVLLKGAFVMAVSSLEVALTDSLTYYLARFPQKISKDDFKFSKETFIENHFRLIDITAEKFVNSLAYRSFRDFFNKYSELCSIEWRAENQELLDNIQEINATRNLLLHNKLIVNDLYVEQAGAKCREQGLGRRLKVDYLYVQTAVSYIIMFFEILLAAIEDKYKNYTVVEANKRLWAFMFDSPVMPYDDFWQYDLQADHIFAYKRGQYEKVLSSTEILSLGLWRAHFNGDCEYLKNFHMRRFDRIVQEKVLFFLSIAPWFDFE